MDQRTKRTADYQINNTTFRVAYGDITKLVADALVSSDDNYLTMGGGVSYAILQAGGDEVRRQALKHVPLKLGDVAVSSAGKLAAKYIFHAATIDYDNLIFPGEDTIRAATLKCMQLADSLQLRLIAFPALGTGVGGFPFKLAGEVMTQTISDYLMGETGIELVTLSLLGRENVSETDLNVLYERAVALASVASQSKKLASLLSELHKVAQTLNRPDLSKRFTDLQAEVSQAGTLLSESQFEKLDSFNRRVVDLSTETQQTINWNNEQLEAEVIRTKLNGLLAQLNIQTANLNKLQIEKAKYGGIGVPPRLENAIEEIEREIARTNASAQQTREQLFALRET